MRRYGSLFILLVTKRIKTLIMNRYMYDMHVVKYVNLHVLIQLILAECVNECSQSQTVSKSLEFIYVIVFL